VILVLCVTINFTPSTFVSAGKKGSLYIVGGSKGCGPALLYKSNGKDGKKGETIIMNPCHDDDYGHDSHHTTSFIPYPMFTGYGGGHYGGGGGYGGGGYGGGYGDGY